MMPVLLASAEEMVPVIALTGSMIVAIVCILGHTIRRMSQHKQFEASRREIAAYVAEGSISPDDAAKLLAVQLDHDQPCWKPQGQTRTA